MQLTMNANLGDNYTSGSQKIRVITENWVYSNIFCPYCGNEHISKFTNNKPVADFYCDSCKEEYELKSKSGSIGTKVVDGAYDTMIKRINDVNNPNFFFLSYNKQSLKVQTFIMVPSYFFVPEIIEKRAPLAENARRAGWVGCNILLNSVPQEGRIYIVKNSKAVPTSDVIEKSQNTSFVKSFKLNARGWILDVLNCVNLIKENEFSLAQMYSFENELSLKHPENNHIKDKIRQQLQYLRDNNIIEFLGNGKYRKITNY